MSINNSDVVSGIDNIELECVSSLAQMSKNHIDPDNDGVKVIFCVRNEKFRLPYFLEYYRNLGVNEFFAIDNNSTDDTQAYLLSQPDVNVFHTSASYKESNAGRIWTSELADLYCQGKWCLTLDVDEFLLYPFIEEVDLPMLTGYLQRWKFEGLFSVFLDFYSEGPLSQAEYKEGSSPFRVCNQFDTASSYWSFETPNFPYIQIKGGIRQRKFWNARDPRSGPSMRKLVLVKWNKNFEYLHSTHSSTPIRLADFTGVIAHFKFMSHIKEFSKAEVARNDRVENSADWKVYANKLSEEDVIFSDPEYSVTYADSYSLINDGHMRPSVQCFDYFARKLLDHPNGAESDLVKRRLEIRESIRQEVRDERVIRYSQLTKLWGPIALFNLSFGVDKRFSNSMFQLQNHMDKVVDSRLWRSTYSLRRLGAKIGISNRKSITEQHYDDQDLFTSFRFVYGSIWWDILGFVRLPVKLSRKLKRKLFGVRDEK